MSLPCPVWHQHLRRPTSLMVASWSRWKWKFILLDIDVYSGSVFAFSTLKDLSQHHSPGTCKSLVIWSSHAVIWPRKPYDSKAKEEWTCTTVVLSCTHHPLGCRPERAMGQPLEGRVKVRVWRWNHVIIGQHSPLHIIHPQINTTIRCWVPSR